MAYFNFSFGRNRLPNYVERDSSGGFFYGFLDAFKNFLGTKKGFSDAEKIQIALSNPAVLYVLDKKAKMFSQAKFNKWQNEKLIEKDFLYSIAKKPNPFQSWIDFHYDVDFYRSIGNVYIYKVGNIMYCLNPAGIELTTAQENEFKSLYFTESSSKKIKKSNFKYKEGCGQSYNFDLNNLHILSDLSNGLSGSWFKANSKLDALYQFVQNSEITPKAKYINTEFSGKFLVTGQHDENNISSMPMSDKEQQSLIAKLRGNSQVIGTKTKTDVQRFTDNLAVFKFDESFVSDVIFIGAMYGMSKDVLDLNIKGATYENKEKAAGQWIDYNLMPQAKQLTDLYEEIFNLEDVRPSWEDLPFNQVFKAQKVANDKIQLENLKIAQELGLNAKLIDNKLNEIYGL